MNATFQGRSLPTSYLPQSWAHCIPPPTPPTPVCHLSEAPQKMRARRKWVPPSPNPPHPHPAPAARSRRLKPEPQEVVLRSILSGQTNYSPFDKRALFIYFFFVLPSYMSFLAPLPHRPRPHRRLLASFIVLILAPLGQRQKGSLPALSQTESHSEAKRAAAAVAQPPPPQNSGKYSSCGVPSRLVVFLPTVSPPPCCRVS